jgi:hypothetical protein
MLTLPGLLLLAAFFISGGVRALTRGVPTAYAARQSEKTENVVHQQLVSCVQLQQKPTFGGVIVVNKGEVVCGNVTSFGSEVDINGEVDGDVVAFGGNVVINGAVDGNVALYGGNLTFLNGSHVNGDIHVCGGRWNRGSDTTLHGSILDCPGGLSTFLGNDVGVNFRFWSTLAWVVLGVLLTTLLPEHVMLVRTTVKSKMRRSFVLGLLSILLAPAIIAVLFALIISIPLAILVLLGLIAAWALGTVAVGWGIGDYILRKIAPHQNTRGTQVVVGVAVLALAGTLPYVGWLICLGAGLLGLGAVFLSRFGTRLYSQPKHPLPL